MWSTQVTRLGHMHGQGHRCIDFHHILKVPQISPLYLVGKLLMRRVQCHRELRIGPVVMEKIGNYTGNAQCSRREGLCTGDRSLRVIWDVDKGAYASRESVTMRGETSGAQG